MLLREFHLRAMDGPLPVGRAGAGAEASSSFLLRQQFSSQRCPVPDGGVPAELAEGQGHWEEQLEALGIK